MIFVMAYITNESVSYYIRFLVYSGLRQWHYPLLIPEKFSPYLNTNHNF